MQYTVCQVTLHPHRVENAWQSELQYVHLAEAEEQETTTVLGGDLGRDGSDATHQ